MRISKEEREYFPISVGLRAECVMSLFVFIIFMDGVEREVNVRLWTSREGWIKDLKEKIKG